MRCAFRSSIGENRLHNFFPIMKAHVLITTFVALGISTPLALRGQGTLQCVTPNWMSRFGGVVWSAYGSTGLRPPSDSEITEWLHGEFRFVQVTTEGTNHPSVAIRTLRTVPITPSVGKANMLMRFIGDTTPHVLLVGKLIADTGLAFDSAATVAPHGRGMSFTYYSQKNLFTMGESDRGEMFFLLEVGPGHFLGRWFWGGEPSAIGIVQRGEYTVGEEEGGYFCAGRRERGLPNEWMLDEGQRWRYRTRPGEDSSTLEIHRIGSRQGRRVIHISVHGVHLKNPRGAAGYSTEVPFITIEEGALRRSLTKRVGTSLPSSPDFEQGFGDWLNQGKPSAWSIPVDSILTKIEDSLSRH